MDQGTNAPRTRADEPPACAFTRALIVANPIAGRGRGERAARALAQGLERTGIASALHFTRARSDARDRLARLEDDVDLVVAVGGDGTLREVLEGLGARDVPVAMLPMGTANVLGLDLGLPRDVEQVLALIRGARTRRLDTARINGSELSFLVTGVGIDGQIVRELERTRRGPITKWSYVAAGWRALRAYRPPRLRVTLDGQELAGHFGLVLASNVVHYAGFALLDGGRRLDDGLFEFYLFEHGERRHLFGYAARALVRGLPGGTCHMRRGRSARIVSDVPVPYHVDGDWRGETPVAIDVGRAQVRILVP